MSLAWVWSQYKACLSETDDLKTHPENISQPTAWIWSQYRGVQGETSQTLPILADEISLAWVWSVFKGVNIAYDDSNVTGAPKLSSSPSIDAAHLEINATSTPSVVTSLLFYLGLIALSFLFSLFSKIDYPTSSLSHSASKSHDALCALAPNPDLAAILYVQKLAETLNCD